MEDIRIEIDGIDELRQNLIKLNVKVNREIKNIIEKAAEIIAKDMRTKVPKDTEDLYKSIEVKELDPQDAGVRIGIGPVGKDVYYWFFVEYGTQDQQAQPFIRPAFDENEQAVRRQITQELRKLIQRGSV